MTGFLEPDDMYAGEDEEDEEEEEEEEDVPQLMPIEKKDKKRKADFSPDVVNNKKIKVIWQELFYNWSFPIRQ